MVFDINVNINVEGFHATLNGTNLLGNPLGLVEVRSLDWWWACVGGGGRAPRSWLLLGEEAAECFGAWSRWLRAIICRKFAAHLWRALNACAARRLLLPFSLQAVQQNEGMPLPQGGVTVNSPHSADSYASLNEWSYEIDGYNVNDLGLISMVNLKVRSERCGAVS